MTVVPAYIITAKDGAELGSDELLFRMFQIHHLREQWGPVQQCHALEGTYGRIIRRKSVKSISDLKASVKAITEELATATGIDQRTAWDRVKFLRWPEDVKNSMYSKPDAEGYWYICEIEEKIMLPALSNYPEYFDKVDADEVRRELFGKLNRVLERSTDVRKVGPFFKAELRRPVDRKALCRVLDRLRKEPEMTYTEAQEELTKALPSITKRDPPTPRRLLNLMASLEADLETFDVSVFSNANASTKPTRTEFLSATLSLESRLGSLAADLAEPKA